MTRKVALAAITALCLAACGDSVTSATVTTGPPTTAGTSTQGSSTSATSPSSTVTEARDAAPDFTLGLGGGGTFVLAEEARPVYLVFWAEW